MAGTTSPYSYREPGYDYNPTMSDVQLHHRHQQGPGSYPPPPGPYPPQQHNVPHSPRPYPPGGQPPYAQGPNGVPLGAYDPPRAPQRTPSPTPTEIAEVNAPLYDISHLKSKDWWFQWRLVPWYIGILVLVAGFTLLTVYHKQIVAFLKPAADWMHDLKFGYLIPVGIFFVISFPPLFGHEIVAVICGLVWGLGIGFAITCVGTLIGEVGNYYAFKYCLRGRAEKLEKEKPYYDCLARVVREGGFKVALMARLSAIPGHFTTAIFATCGMGIWTFLLAAILSLPKQFITVYAGVMLEASDEESKKEADPSSNGTAKKDDTTQKIISDVVAGLSVFITFYALWYIYKEMQRVKPAVFRDRRKARLAKLNALNDQSADTLGTRVGTVRFDKYGGSGAGDEEAGGFELRDKDRFARNRQRGLGEGDAESGESAASDAPLATGGRRANVMAVDYGAESRQEQFSQLDRAATAGYASPGQQYSGVYAGGPGYDHHPQPQRAPGSRKQSADQQFYPPMPPPPGAGYARPTPTQQAYPRPPDQYRNPPQPNKFVSPPGSPPPGHGQEATYAIPNPFNDNATPRQHAFAPASPPGTHVPVTVPPLAPPPTTMTTSGTPAPRYALSDGPGPKRNPSMHSREETDVGDGPGGLNVPTGPERGGMGTRHVSEATAYYSADEGEDDDDVPDLKAPPPGQGSKMPGSLFREESEPGPGWR